MSHFKTASEVLDFAIREEEAAAGFYTEMASRAKSPRMRDVFESFAREELAHKGKLEKVRIEASGDFSSQDIANMQAEDYSVEEAADPDRSYAKALQLVMAKERAAFRLYTRLAEAAVKPEIRELLLALAQEEASHKLSFELEYDQIAEK